MATGEDLTILLTLKDRVAFTSRWMAYADSVRFPFKVLIADGGTDEQAAELLSDPSCFPNVDYQYVRYPVDRSYPDYYAKIAGALCRVSTPYVALADNDDFFFVDSLSEAVEFLSVNPNYVSCGGQGAVFWVRDSGKPDANRFLYGDNIEWKSTREIKSIDGDTARARIAAQAISTADTFFYDVRKTTEARKYFETVRALGPRDLYIFEQIVCFLSAIGGKAKRLDSLYLARQVNSPDKSGGNHTRAHGDWFSRMLAETWSADFTGFVSATTKALAETDGISEDEARIEMVRNYRMLVAPALLSNILEEPSVSLKMSTVVPLVRRLVGLREGNLLKSLARTIYRRVGWISLDSVYGTELVAGKVPDARKRFRAVQDFLMRRAP